MATYTWPPISVSTSAPIGGATEAKQDVQITQTNLIANRTMVLPSLYFTYAGVSNAGYTQLIASTSSDIKHVTWFESSGQPMVVALGASGAEVDLFMVPPGGFNGEIPFPIPAGSRVSIKQLTSDALGSGIFIVANFLK
jgi:hypothetical protein